MRGIACLAVVATGLVGVPWALADDPTEKPASEPPLTAAERERLENLFASTIRVTGAVLKDDPDDLAALSQRGDAHFFRGEFDQALADYERMIEVDPRKEASHWRRGIAAFYAGDYTKAARQFERYHSFDDVDRENGIWRYFAQAKAQSVDRARANLLKYKQTDREPFPAVYQLFQGKTTPEAIFAAIERADVDAQELQGRRFYAELYVGLDHALHGRDQEARQHLARAVANPWPRQAGYGPTYMWHVGRVHLNRLEQP
jgi:lipoprotein NlpI